MVGRFYMEVYKISKLIKKCIVYKMRTTVRQERSWKVYEHETLKVRSLGQQVKANTSSLLDHPLCEGIPVLQHSRSYPCPSGRDKPKLVRGFEVWKLCLV